MLTDDRSAGLRDGEKQGRSEAAFLSAAAMALLVAALVTLPLSAALAGTPGLLGAAAALAFLLVLFGISSLLHVVAAPHGRDIWLMLTVGGLGLRLVLYVALLRALRNVEMIDGTALGLSAAAGIVIGQVFEMRALIRARTRDVMRAGSAPSPTRPGAQKESEGVAE